MQFGPARSKNQKRQQSKTRTLRRRSARKPRKRVRMLISQKVTTILANGTRKMKMNPPLMTQMSIALPIMFQLHMM